MTFTASDTQFGYATGGNVGRFANASEFDGPPSASTNLVVTPVATDDDPRLFAPGDTYDLSFDSPDGPVSLSGAEVIRSDAGGGPNAGVIVFEGTDTDGEVVQVVWAPGVDVQAWYDSFPPSSRKSFYNEDMNTGYTHRFVCFASEARIGTPYGQTPVGRLRAGDRVTTLDAGAQPVRWVGQRRVTGRGQSAPVMFAPGAIGNTAPLRLSPQHRVFLQSPLAALHFGTAEVLVPAIGLVGLPGVGSMPCAEVTYVHLLLDRHHVLWAEGARCESLFIGPVASDRLSDPSGPPLPQSEASAVTHDRAARPVLSFAETRLLTRLMGGTVPCAPQREMAF